MAELHGRNLVAARFRGHHVRTGADPLTLRDEFFRSQAPPTQLLQPYERLPGVVYFVKDAKGRYMAVSRGIASRLGLESEEALIGQTDHDVVAKKLADKYVADDRHVLRNGRPLLNLVEVGIDEYGFLDWVVTDKYPLRGTDGRVIGLIGTSQSFEVRKNLLVALGPVGKAAAFIRDHVRGKLSLAEVAEHVSLSERQLQRTFHRAFGLSVGKFIIRSRVHAAVRELVESEKSMAQIAKATGFGDQSAFSNTFRRFIGVAPRAYRQNYLANLIQGSNPPGTRDA